MKKIIIIFATLLVGASAIAGAITSASLGWTLKEKDESIYLTLKEGSYQYENITLELLDGPFVWLDPDETTTEDFGNISIITQKPITGDIHLSIDAGSYAIGEKITITLENRGSQAAYFYGPSYHWTIDQYVEGTWKRAYPDIEFLGYHITQINPGEKEVDTWDQKTLLNGQVNPGDYRVVVYYCMEEQKYEFTEYIYFSISALTITIDDGIPGDVILELPDHPTAWKDHYEDIFIPMPPAQTIPIGDLPAIPIERIPFPASDLLDHYEHYLQ